MLPGGLLEKLTPGWGLARTVLIKECTWDQHPWNGEEGSSTGQREKLSQVQSQQRPQ